MHESERAAALPNHSILLHVGAHKTGTTTVQAALFAARELLLAQGVVNLVARGDETANPAARAVQRLPASASAGPPVPYSIWTQLVGSAHEQALQRVVISGEAFGVSEPIVISKIAEDLGLRRLHVVITLRPIAKILPSQWQQDLHGSWISTPFDDWLRLTLADARPTKHVGPIVIPHRFWFRHRHDALVERWASVIGRDRITLIVVNDQRPSELLETFEHLLSLRVGTLTNAVGMKNRSMTLPEMQVMRHYSAQLESTELGQAIIEKSRYHKALRILRKIRPDNSLDAKLIIPEWSAARVGEIQREMIERMQISGVRVIGSLSALDWLPSPESIAAQVSHDVHALASEEIERLTEKMRKSAARRLGVGEEVGTEGHAASDRPTRRPVAPRVVAVVARAMRLTARFLRLRL